MAAVIDLAKYRAAADIREGLREMDAWEKSRLRWLLQTANHPDPTKRRPNQLTPGGDWWNVALWLAGRGYGKTRIGSEDVADYCRTHRDVRYAGVFETFADGRDVVVEGESGILRSVPPSAIVDWNRSLGELIFTTGSRFDIYSGQKPDALRGPQHHRAWVNEPAKFRYLPTRGTTSSSGSASASIPNASSPGRRSRSPSSGISCSARTRTGTTGPASTSRRT